MSESSSADVEGESGRESSSSEGNATSTLHQNSLQDDDVGRPGPGPGTFTKSESNANGYHISAIELLRQRSQILALRLQQAQGNTAKTRNHVEGITAAAQFMRMYIPLLQPPPNPVAVSVASVAPGQQQQTTVATPATSATAPAPGPPGGGGCVIGDRIVCLQPSHHPMPRPIPLPYNYPVHTYAMPVIQSLPPFPSVAAANEMFEPQQQAAPPSSQALQVSPFPTPKKKKSKRALNHEVDALKELVQTLTAVSPELHAYAQCLIRQSKILSQLEWMTAGERARLDSLHRMDGGSDIRRLSEISSNSSNSIQQLQQQHQLQAFLQKQQQQHQQQQLLQLESVRKRNRKRRGKPRKNAPRSLRTELDAMRSYINKIVQYYLGTDQALATDLQFTGDFTDLEAHAQRLVAAGYGRIVEEEIRINRKNNRQAFITLSADREALERDAIVLIPVARRYAFEGDTVRAFVLNVCATVSKPGETSVGSSGASGGNPSLSLADDEELTDETESQESDADVDGDNVVIISSDNCPKAFVIAITKQTELRQIVGTISFTNPIQLGDDDKLFYKFRPYDMRVPMVYIAQEACSAHIANCATSSKQPEDICGLLFLAHILETDRNGHCIADLIQPVGRVGNLDDELKAILFHNGLRDIKPYKQHLEDLFSEEAPPVTPNDLHNRCDLRKKCIFTIDPLTARDLDDAMSIEKLDDDLFEVGVHISDVAHYLLEDSELDNIVKERSTSIYLVNQVVHMLPRTLCLRCSLLPGIDKFAFSVFWKMNANGQILSPEPVFTRSVINSCTQFAYEHAQKIIDNPHENFTDDDFPSIVNGFHVEDVMERIRWLHNIAQNMRKSRFEQGALTINNAKLRFTLDPLNGEPITFEVEKQREANRMIEEFMLLANQSVARHIHAKYPEISVLRNHPPPLVKSLKALREKFVALGFDLDYSSSKALQESMVRLCQEAPDPIAMNACLSQLLMKPMARASYFCSEGKTEASDLWHYALSIPIYTHFTSPIRRYPDVMVHRLLAASLNYCPTPGRTPDELHSLTKIANERKYNAKLAGDDSGNLYFKRYVRNRQGIYMYAVVIEIYQHIMNVVTLESGHVISINYKMQKVLVETQHAPNFILVADRTHKQSAQKLQLLSVVPIRLIVWDNKLTGFLLTADQQRQRNYKNSNAAAAVSAVVAVAAVGGANSGANTATVAPTGDLNELNSLIASASRRNRRKPQRSNNANTNANNALTTIRLRPQQQQQQPQQQQQQQQQRQQQTQQQRKISFN
ncbi:DIS3-like exonuclease 2 [Drosophila tropicalis]|uniref:DIS3-like exonuclease 2 n=1 Tax=Drosophila tropicalis TaxID=46794 RepID=UPI0035ABE8BB